MTIAKKYGYDYWDGNRRYGYGGYKYIPEKWTFVAKKLIKKYKLNNNSKHFRYWMRKSLFAIRNKKNSTQN